MIYKDLAGSGVRCEKAPALFAEGLPEQMDIAPGGGERSESNESFSAY